MVAAVFVAFHKLLLQGINDFLFLVVNANPILLHYVIAVYLVKIFLLRIGQGSRPLLPIDWRNLLILRRHI
jgi:hypothetical protein